MLGSIDQAPLEVLENPVALLEEGVGWCEIRSMGSWRGEEGNCGSKVGLWRSEREGEHLCAQSGGGGAGAAGRPASAEVRNPQHG